MPPNSQPTDEGRAAAAKKNEEEQSEATKKEMEKKAELERKTADDVAMETMKLNLKELMEKEAAREAEANKTICAKVKELSAGSVVFAVQNLGLLAIVCTTLRTLMY